MLLPLLISEPVSPGPILVAMKGPWVGFLEYKDYEGPGNVRIACMARMTADKDGQGGTWRLVFDEGPSKVLEERESFKFNAPTDQLKITSDGVERYFKIADPQTIRADGTGTLTLLGTGTENDKAVDVRLTYRIATRRLSILRETRVGTAPFTFRSRFELNSIR